MNWIELELKENELNWNWIERFWIWFELELNWIEKSWIQLELELNWIERNELIRALRVTLNFDGWPWKTIGHLFYVASSFVHHFTAISEFKLELQSGNAQFWSKSTIFFSCVTLKFNGWPSTRQIWGIWKLRPAYNPETPNLGQNWWCFVPCDLDGWPWKTIGHLSFAVSSFVQHFIAIGEFKLELLSGNTQFGSNSMIFRAVWPWNLTYDLEKQ